MFLRDSKWFIFILLILTDVIIFLSGVFDGEGSFGIWSKLKTKKYFACSVEMTDKDMIQRFYKFFGGCMYLCKRRKQHHKDTWRWKINGQGALSTVDKMINYLSYLRYHLLYFLLYLP